MKGKHVLFQQIEAGIGFQEHNWRVAVETRFALGFVFLKLTTFLPIVYMSSKLKVPSLYNFGLKVF